MIRRSLFVALLLVGLPSATMAGALHASAGPHHPPPAVATKDPQNFSFVGRVTKVDYAANAVVLSAKGGSVMIRVTPTTAIDIGGEPGSIADIRPGVRIRAEGIVRGGGALIAVAISVL